jgi:hypothetical protein
MTLHSADRIPQPFTQKQRVELALSFLFVMPGLFLMIALLLMVLLPGFSFDNVVTVPFFRTIGLGLIAVCTVLGIGNARRYAKRLSRSP